MLLVTRLSVFAGALVLVGANTCLAGAATVARCPADLHGHPPARADAASLFDGDPRNNALLAPSESRGQSNTWWQNVWRFNPGSAANVTVICRYETTREAVVFKLPASVRICRQDPTSFACE